MKVLLTQHSDRNCDTAYREKPRNAEKFFGWLFEAKSQNTIAEDLREGREDRFRLLEYLGYHNNRTETPHRFSVWGKTLLRLSGKYPDIQCVHLPDSDLTLELRKIDTEEYSSIDYAASEEGFEWRLMEVDYYKLIQRRRLKRHIEFPDGLPTLYGHIQKDYNYRTFYTYEKKNPQSLVPLPRDINYY